MIEEMEISRVGRRRSWTGANCSAAVTQDVHTQCWGHRSRNLSELMVDFLALDKTAIEQTRQSGCCSNLFTFACAPTLLEIVREHCIESWRHPYQLRRSHQALKLIVRRFLLRIQEEAERAPRNLVTVASVDRESSYMDPATP